MFHSQKNFENASDKLGMELYSDKRVKHPSRLMRDIMGDRQSAVARQKTDDGACSAIVFKV